VVAPAHAHIPLLILRKGVLLEPADRTYLRFDGHVPIHRTYVPDFGTPPPNFTWSELADIQGTV
jgi:hypothetical protein